LGAQGSGSNSAELQAYENLPIGSPPGPEQTIMELNELHNKQSLLVSDHSRQKEIIKQATNQDMSDVFVPLGLDVNQGSATEKLIYTVLRLAQHIGFHYKTVFDRARPNQVDPSLRPFIPNPPHPAYPSNHAFQMFSIAEVMTRILPGSPQSAELYRVAQRVGENREYAGLHYKSDTEAGQRLASYCSPFLIAVCAEKIDYALEEWN